MNSHHAASRSRVLTGNQALQPTVGQNCDTPLFSNYMDQTGGISEGGGSFKRHIHLNFNVCMHMRTYTDDGLMVKRGGSWGRLWFPVFPFARRVNRSDGWMMEPPCSQHSFGCREIITWKLAFGQQNNVVKNDNIITSVLWGAVPRIRRGEKLTTWEWGGGGRISNWPPRWCKQAYFQALLLTW